MIHGTVKCKLNIIILISISEASSSVLNNTVKPEITIETYGLASNLHTGNNFCFEFKVGCKSLEKAAY